MRGQSALEFLVLLGFMVLVFTTFTVVVQQRSSEMTERVQYQELRKVAETLEREVGLASQVQEGYFRAFRLPTTVNGNQYEISLEPQGQRPSEIIVSDGENEYILFLAQNLTVVSTAGPGNNLISKDSDGDIEINHYGFVEIGCDSDFDCSGADDLQCQLGHCVGAMGTALSYCDYDQAPIGSSCDPEDQLSCMAYGCDESGSCSGVSTCPGGKQCISEGGGTCSCPVGRNEVMVRAGTQGYDWDTSGVSLREDMGAQGVCCNAATQCVWDRSPQDQGYCFDLGTKVNNAWYCDDLSNLGGEPGPTWLRCYETPDKKGVTFTSNSGTNYCCSKNSINDNFVFNTSVVSHKREDAKSADGSFDGCTDGYDNDCNGLIDELDPACAICPVPAPTNLGVETLAWDSVGLNWTPRTGPETTGQVIRVGPNWDPGVKSDCSDGSCNIEQDIVAEDPNYSLGDAPGDVALLPGKGYYARLVNLDSDGYCNPSYSEASLSFITPPRLKTECGGTSAEEDMILEHNLQGTRFIYDWLKEDSSHRKLFLNFDVHNNPSLGKTKDYSCTFASCNPHHGTLSGVDHKTAECTKPNGEVGGCYYFSWDDRINVADGIFSSIIDDFTMAAWVKTPITTDFTYYEDWQNPDVAYREGKGYLAVRNQRFAFHPSRSHSYGSTHMEVGFTVGTNGVIVWIYNANNNVYWPVLIYPDDTEFGDEGEREDRLKSNTWHHVAVVYKEGIPHLYIDGRYADKGISSSFTVHPSENIGGLRYVYDSDNYYNDFLGYIDDAAVYAAALGPGELRKQYLGLGNQLHEDEIAPGDQWRGCVMNISGGIEGEALCSDSFVAGTGTSTCQADNSASACMASTDMTSKSNFIEDFGDQGKDFITGTWGEGGSSQCCGESESEWYVNRAIFGQGTTSQALCCPTESHCVDLDASTGKYECKEPHSTWNDDKLYCFYNGIMECDSQNRCAGASTSNANYMCTSEWRNVGGILREVYFWKKKVQPIESCS